MYNHIMVPLDGSGLAECVLPHVEALAKGCAIRNITLVRAVERVRAVGDDSFLPEDIWQRYESENKAAAEEYLSQITSKLDLGGGSVKTAVMTSEKGLVADTIADYAQKNDIDLIVVASHGRSGISRWVMGSVADRVLRSACIPVLTVRAPGCIPGV